MFGLYHVANVNNLVILKIELWKTGVLAKDLAHVSGDEKFFQVWQDDLE
jgi:hypothetical protein